MSTGRLEKFLELPETCSVIPASCNSEQQPETETVLQDVTVVPHNYSKVSNNFFFIFFGIYPLPAEDSITGILILLFYIWSAFIQCFSKHRICTVKLFNIILWMKQSHCFLLLMHNRTMYLQVTCIIERDLKYEQ